MHKINWGIRAHDLGPAELHEMARRIEEKGFSHVHLALYKAFTGLDAGLGKMSPGMGQIVSRALAARGVKVSILGCYINPVHPDEAVRKAQVAHFIEHLRVVREFGCCLVGTETGSPTPDNSPCEGIYSEETFQVFMESLRTMVGAAEKLGALVAIEGVADSHTIHSHERMKRVLDMIPSPNLGIIYDPVNFLPAARASESDDLMREAFELFAPRMLAIHAKDYRMEGGHKNGNLRAGRGQFNFPLLVELISKHKPMIQVTLENNPPETIDETIRFLDSISGRY